MIFDFLETLFYGLPFILIGLFAGIMMIVATGLLFMAISAFGGLIVGGIIMALLFLLFIITS